MRNSNLNFKLFLHSTLILKSNSVIDGYYLDHAENADMLEEDSVDRLWLVVRSLKSPTGKEVTH